MTDIYSLASLDNALNDILESQFTIHPFAEIPDAADYESLFANYFAMSQAFPYLQAGSQKDLFFRLMENNEDVPEHIELTTVVGNFLCWDETGGLNPTVGGGLAALPYILETQRFHANILRKDGISLFGKEIKPDYSAVTKDYLMRLYASLASACPVTRVSAMIAFESHANQMISALWGSLAKRFDIDKNKLHYFYMHVGGDDPAEKYHVEMTRKLIQKTIPVAELPTFYEKFTHHYQLNSEWCRDVVKMCQSQSIAA